jgi:hypothetical protein
MLQMPQRLVQFIRQGDLVGPCALIALGFWGGGFAGEFKSFEIYASFICVALMAAGAFMAVILVGVLTYRTISTGSSNGPRSEGGAEASPPPAKKNPFAKRRAGTA